MREQISGWSIGVWRRLMYDHGQSMAFRGGSEAFSNTLSHSSICGWVRYESLLMDIYPRNIMKRITRDLLADILD